MVLLTFLPSRVPQAHATPMGTITVTTLNDNNTVDGLCTLREAITRANLGSASADCPGATAGGNTIVLPSGTLTLASQLPTISSALIITGNGPANTIVEANATANTATWRIFQFNSASVAFEIHDLTLRHGGNDSTFNSNGGCVILSNGTASLTVSNVTFSHCATASSNGGGAIAAINGGTLTISDSTFSYNSSTNVTSGGGAININGGTNSASLTITNSTFSHNSLTSDSSGRSGGAIYCILCSLSITNTIFNNNSTSATGGSSGGGALYLNTNLAADLTGVTFTNNTVSATTEASGGALDVAQQRAISLTITNSVFSDNALTGGSTREGGAIYIGNGTLALSSSRLVANNANGNGSALYHASPQNTTIRQSCITGNGTSAVFDEGFLGTIDATGGGTAANANWWGTSWGPRIAAAGGGSAVSNGDAINGNGNTVLGSILVDVDLSDAGSPSTPPTGDWLTTAPTVAGALCDTLLPTVAITPAAFNVNEGNNADFTLTRTGSTTSTVVVSVDITLGGGTDAADYTLSGGTISGQSGNQTVTIPAGQASVNVNFAAATDGDAEANNSVTMTLVDGAAYNLGAATASTATIPANTITAVTLTSLGATPLLTAGGWVVWVGAMLLLLLASAFAWRRQWLYRGHP
ncbi:MAG: CSLREA domain-containing protein [Chloroflexi bacterium]|nr:CSLREA domain-containing protein [Chloroflexota bacterium]